MAGEAAWRRTFREARLSDLGCVPFVITAVHVSCPKRSRRFRTPARVIRRRRLRAPSRQVAVRRARRSASWSGIGHDTRRKPGERRTASRAEACIPQMRIPKLENFRTLESLPAPRVSRDRWVRHAGGGVQVSDLALQICGIRILVVKCQKKDYVSDTE